MALRAMKSRKVFEDKYKQLKNKPHGVTHKNSFLCINIFMSEYRGKKTEGDKSDRALA
ncbi:hypothetical protein PB16LOC_04336 [Pectobacterium versatile]|nr:hypothetical protein PB16LOC_04336 [Pectobacterium versatile]